MEKLKKRCLTLLLSLAMIVTYMPTSMIAYAVDADSQDQIEQQATDNAESAVAEAETPSVAEEESVPNEDAEEADAAVADAAETAESTETAEATESQDAEAAEATEEAEAADGEEVDQAEEAVEVEETAEEEKVFEAGSLDAEGSGYKVTLTYSAEAEIPENATLKVKEIKDSLFGRKYDEYLDQTSDKLGKNVPYARFFDITILDEEGNEVQPATPVKVDIQLGDLDSAVVGMKNVELAAVHFDEESGAEKVDVDFIRKSESVDFSAKSFSVYGVAYTYTVDFYYTPGDEDSTTSYSMEGGSSMMLSELFAQLGIDENVKDVKSITSKGYEGVTSSLEDSLTFAKQFGGDYKISSLQPFDDWYYVTVTMKDGTTYTISVTDPPGGSGSQATTNTTVDHIDIGIVAAASINIPLAYGDYYDSEGNTILTVPVGEYLQGTGVNENVDITQADLRSATITAACDNSSQNTNFTISNYSTSTGDSGIEQVRIGGTYYTGTLANPVNYTVTVNKSITLNMTYNGQTLYTADGDPVTVTVQAALSATFNYFDEDNDCPGIRSDNTAGYVDNSAGMDFVLGTTDDQDTSLTAIEIIKYIVDEDGNVIKTDKGYDFAFEVYQNTDGNVEAPAAWSGDYSGDVDYSGYSKLSNKTLTTSTDGLGLVYDYSVADSALVYIKEGTPVNEIKDSAGNTLKYQSTYIETEYVWRNDGGETHSNINQYDTLTAIPDVVGDYTSDTYDGNLHNTFLEFYVYNVYGPDTGDLTVSKTVNSILAADKTKEFTFTVTLSDTSINGTYGDMTFTNGVATVELTDGKSAKAEGLPVGTTYTVEETAADGFTTTKTGDTGTISKTESTAAFTNTRQTGDLEVSKKLVSDLAADANQEFTIIVTLNDTSISGTYGDMSFTNGVATVKLKGGESAKATGLPTGVTYTVAETAPDGFTATYSGATGTISTTAATATVTNTRDTGDLKVSKTVVSDAAADANAQFTFTVTLSDTTISGTFGDMNFTNGVARVTLKGGESATAEGLPTGITYTVTEADAAGFDNTAKTGDTGSISKDAKAEASFTNTRQKGDLELRKVVESDAAADKDQAFTFTVTLSDTTINGTYGGMTFTNGVATVTLKGGEKATATGLPTGITYTIAETAADGFTTKYDSNSGTISTTKSTSIYTNTRVTSGLVVSKAVVSDAAADKNQEFTFTVTLSDTSINGTYGDMTFTDGVATVELKGGESAEAKGLPTSVTYTVTETAVDGFTTEKTGDTGTITADSAATAAFTNTRKTGDLEVSKTVVSDAAADKNQEFTFTVTLSDKTINGTYDGMTFTDGVATVTLKGGEKATATGLPTGITYTVTEAAVEGFTNTAKTGDAGTISTTASAASFTNTRETGDLEVSKVVKSDLAADADEEFTFTVTLSDTTINGTYGGMTFTDGVATVTLKGGESATAEGLPTSVTYTVAEADADGFTTESEGESGTISKTASTAEFTNTRETGDLEVSKTVVSDLAADADKEFEFTVTLGDTTINGEYGDMTFTDGEATFTLKGGESASATGLPTSVTYTVVETADEDFTTSKTGDSGSISADEAATAAFTNTRKTGDLEVSKTVVSDLAADTDKEFTFTVTLSDTTISGTFGDMTFTDGEATFTLKGGETATAEGLPTDVTYTVVETADEDFTTEKTGDTGTITTTASTAAFTNTRKTGDLEVSKIVVSDLAADADKAFTFTVTLSDTTISGTYGDMTFTDGVATFTLKGGETATAEGLPTDVTYTVAETAADGFTTTKTGDTGTISTEKSSAAFTNTRETGDLEVSKIVVSDLAADADKEFEFTVTLGDTSISGTYGDMTFRNGVATFTLKGGESATATGLPTDVTYTVAEESVDGFSTEYDFNSGSISTTLSESKFTNTRVTSGLVVNKTVVSDLAADADKEFTFTVTLSDTSISGTYGDMTFTNGVATVTLKGGESAKAEGLPTTVEYTVEETAEDGFTTTKTGDTGTIVADEASTASFTNTRDTGDLEVSKTVESDLAADANKAFSFKVTLSDTTISGTYGDMTFTDGVAEFILKDGEKATAEGLPTTVEYTVEETADDDFTTEKSGDTGSISADEAAKAAFTNTRDTGDLEVSKTVVSDLAADADKEFTFTVTLSDTSISGTYGDLTFRSGVATVTLKGGESAKAEGLPTTVEYTVEETAADGFTTESEGDTGTISAEEAAVAEFTNTRDTGDLEVSKTVVSDLAADKDQEFTFTVTLSDTSISGTYGDMSFTDGVATVTLKGGETATAEGLPTTVEYSVEETAVDGFTTEKTGDTGVISAEETAKADFTNTRETGDLEVTKTVVSPLTSDSNIGFAFTVTLGDNTISGTYGDMTFAEGVAEFTLKDGETATAEGLPTTVSYTVEEAEMVGFTTEKTGDTGEISTEKATAKFTNTAITIDIEVTKVWDDAENQDGVRPSGVTVKLLADGEDTGKTLTVSETSDWSGSFTGLAKYNAGTEIEYTITENEVAEYTVAIVGSAAEGFTVTNTHEPEVTSAAVAKIWDDEDDADGVRPDSIKVDLMANGAYTGQSVTLSEDNNWAASIGDLQKNIAGKEIEYTWEEQDVDEYELTDVSVDGEITILTNTHEPEDPTETPKTGDDNNIGGWLALMMLAGAGASGLYIRRRREDQE